MKYRPLIALIVNVLLLGTIQADSPQEPSKSQSAPARSDNQITPVELKEAEAIADRFIKRFRETRDVTPIVREMFTSSFEKTVAEGTSWYALVGLGSTLVEHLNSGERLRCFNVQFSLTYLMRLYWASKVSVDPHDALRSADIFPARMNEFLKHNAPPGLEMKTAEQARYALSFLEKCLKLMQEEAATNPPEVTAQFKKNLDAFEAHVKEHKGERPSGTVDEEDRFGRPAGTRLVKVIIPFHVGLLMVKERGEFKIDMAATNLPPD